MRKQERPFGSRLGRALLLTVGVLGAFVALDAFLVFGALLLAPLFGGGMNPYVGIVMFVALPLCGFLGASLAWAVYVVLSGRRAPAGANGPHARA
jgi:hypothetical protein